MPIDTNKSPKNILGQLISQGLNPRQDNILKAVLKHEKGQVEEALQMGVPPENILKQAGIPTTEQDAVNQISDPNNPTVLTSDERSIANSLAGNSGNFASGNSGEINAKEVLNAIINQNLNGQSKEKKPFDLLDLLSFAVPGIIGIREAIDDRRSGNFGEGKLTTSQMIDALEEKRRIDSEERRDKQLQLNTIEQFGKTATPDEFGDIEQALNIDIDSLIKSGRATRTPEGNLDILDKASYGRMIKEGTFTESEQKDIKSNAEEVNAWARVIRRLSDLGVKEGNSIGEVKFENTNDPLFRELGVTSIPARFELARQFKDDPRYAAVARDIELAFQKFRTRVTGAQASDKEIARLRQIIAKLTDQPGVFFTTVRNFMENSKEDFDTTLQIKRRFQRDTSEFEGLLEDLPSVKQTGITIPSQSLKAPTKDPNQLAEIANRIQRENPNLSREEVIKRVKEGNY